MSQIWTTHSLTQEQEKQRDDLILRLKLHPLVAELLLQREIYGEKEIQRFLYGTLSDLPNPLLLKDMDLAVDRLIEAYAKKEKILFFGDYDVDGITGTSQLQSFFREMQLPTKVLLPHRMQDGYGLTGASLQKIIAEKPDLLVTVDNGTTAQKEISYLKEKGIDVIVIDHHETPSEKGYPPVVALINPKAADSKFEERNIASAGLVFLLLIALRSQLRERGGSSLPNLKRYLDLAAMGTIADIVPLTGTNRLIVKYGLEEIGNTSRPGLSALMNVASVQAPVSASSVAFRLAPRINAAGRLDHPHLALQLLLAQSKDEAEPLATRLDELNRERQQIEIKVLEEAIHQVEKNQTDRKGIVVASSGWHLGVVGIVAAKLTEKYHRPAVVLVLAEDHLEAKGSARTVPGVSVYQALKNIEGEMLRFGGHDAAAGMTIHRDNVENFSRLFDQSVRKEWREEPLPKIHIDAELELHDINTALVKELQLLEPHGAGNPQPVFSIPEVSLTGCRLVGNNHLKMRLSRGNCRMDAIGFNWGHYLETALKVDQHQIAFFPEINDWNGSLSIQLKIKAIMPSSNPKNHSLREIK